MGVADMAMDKLNQANSEEVPKASRKRSKSKPEWYQELSDRQMHIADQLYEAVRDDYDLQESSRVKKILTRLGVNPVTTSSILKKALEMSRGNDLAFLWFLLDICYFTFRKFTEDREYSLNERLLLSCIAHLDMITTMRGLAQILPPITKLTDSCSDYECIEKKAQMVKSCSPYLAEIPKPKIPISKRFARPQPKSADLYPYHVWCDPNHVVFNEQNRWYSQRSDTPAAVERPLSSGEKIVGAFLDETIDNVTSPNFDKARVLKALCLKHTKKSSSDRRCQILEKLFKEKPRTFMSDIEKDVVHQIELDLAQTQAEFECLAKKYQEQTIIRTLIQEMISNTAALEFIQPCEDCPTCKTNLDLYRNLLLRKMEQSPELVQEEKTDVPTTYYQGPSGTNTYEFNYRQIFEDDFKQTCPVKAALDKVLDLATFKSEEEAINDWIRNAWKYELEMWNERQMKEELEKKKKEVVKHEIRDKYESITKLLKDHLMMLAKNPKFVFASLPQACHHPTLREWMRQFYGFNYQRKELERALEVDLLQWNSLTTAMPNRKTISNKDVKPGRTFLMYDARDALHHVNKHLRDDYNTDFKRELMDIDRVYWKSLSPSMCHPRIREIFYAYFPGYEREILNFRPYDRAQGRK